MVVLALFVAFLPAAAIAAPVVSIVVGAALSGAVAASWSVFAAALVLGALSYAMTPRVRNPSIQQDNRQNITVRQSDLPRQVVYGHTRVTSGYAQIEATDVNGKLHIIQMLCDGELRDITEIWLDDYSIPSDWIDSSGNVTQGRYAGFLKIKRYNGSLFQTADPEAVLNIPQWTANHRLQGIAYLYLILDKNQDVYPNGVPNITAIVEGAPPFDDRVNALRWSTNIALYCNDFAKNAVYGYGASASDVDTLNVIAQANICDEIVTTTDKSYSVTLVDSASDIITLSGDILDLEYGDRVQVTSTGTLPSGISAATNYYVIPYQVGNTPRIRLATTLLNAMAKSHIDISSTGSGNIAVVKNGEPRYHGSGIVNADDTLAKTMNDLASCMAGRAVDTAGRWTFRAGAWSASVLSFDEGDLRSAIRLQASLPLSDSFNVVKGLFFSAANYYNSSDYPSAFVQQFISDDNGVEAAKDLNLPFIGRATTAQRIAKIELYKGRQGISFQADFSLKALQVQCGDTVSLTIAKYGWELKEFEVTQFAIVNDNGSLIVRMTLRETAQEIYDWSAGEAITYDPAPNSNLPNPFAVLVPSAVGFNSRLITSTGSDNIYVLRLQWAQHPDSFVRDSGDFEIQYKLSSETQWQPSFFVDGSLTSTDVVTSSINTFYDLRIRARNNLGVRSGWVTILEAQAGVQGGVTSNLDWGSVAVAPTTNLDWISVAVAPTTFNDWGSVL